MFIFKNLLFALAFMSLLVLLAFFYRFWNNPYEKTIRIQKNQVFDFEISLKKLKTRAGYQLIYENSKQENDKIFLDSEAFRMEIANINHDQHQDVLLGVIKATHFDPQVKKRLQIYQLKDGHILPLWLGSRLTKSLEDFTVFAKNGKDYVRAIEKSDSVLYRLADYQWAGSFGLELLQIHKDSLTLAQAKELLFEEINFAFFEEK